MTDTAILQARYDAFCALGLHLDMSRGKPEPRQLDLSLPCLLYTSPSPIPPQSAFPGRDAPHAAAGRPLFISTYPRPFPASSP